MATYISIQNPENEADHVLVLKAILERQKELGSNSPLSPSVMDPWTKSALEFLKLYARIKKMQADVSSLIEEKDKLFGTHNGSNQDVSTIKGKVTQMRKLLAGIYQNRERELVKWGFRVVKTDVPTSQLGYNKHKSVMESRVTQLEEGETDTESPPILGETDPNDTAGGNNVSGNLDQSANDGDIGIGEEGVNTPDA